MIVNERDEEILDPAELFAERLSDAPEEPPSEPRPDVTAVEPPEEPSAEPSQGAATRAVETAAKAAMTAVRRLFYSIKEAGDRAAETDETAARAAKEAADAKTAEEAAVAAFTAARAAEETAKISARAARTAQLAAVLERAVAEAERERPEDTEPETEEAPAESPALPAKTTPNESEKLVKRVKRFERSVKDYQYLILRLLLILLVVWVLFFQVVGVTRMASNEMYPRVDGGDLVLFYRLDTDVRAQDIVVLRKATPSSDGVEDLYVLRVVAVGGDTVEISDSEHLLINGSTMIETNIFYPTPRFEGFTEYPLTLGPDECFVLADRRDGSTDSRYFGPVKRSELLGTVITILRRNNL